MSSAWLRVRRSAFTAASSALRERLLGGALDVIEGLAVGLGHLLERLAVAQLREQVGHRDADRTGHGVDHATGPAEAVPARAAEAGAAEAGPAHRAAGPAEHPAGALAVLLDLIGLLLGQLGRPSPPGRAGRPRPCSARDSNSSALTPRRFAASLRTACSCFFPSSPPRAASAAPPPTRLAARPPIRMRPLSPSCARLPLACSAITPAGAR